jgi:iron complex outermembrane recepter protein
VCCARCNQPGHALFPCLTILYTVKSIFSFILFLFLSGSLLAQVQISGRVTDALTGEALPGSVIAAGPANAVSSDNAGRFLISVNPEDSLVISLLGYRSLAVKASEAPAEIQLVQSTLQLDQVVVSASREEQKRTEAPVAIAVISSQTLRETKPATIDQVLNKVSGVHMVNLGNEQHSMSIRQPMSYGSLFLYLEDGVPLRTSGLFNHNALLEINMAAVRNVEIIRGPASSLYGQEAAGGAVNFITLSPTALPTARIALQANDIGYKRADAVLSGTWKKLGLAAEGYYADRRNGVLQYSDFNKAAFSVKADYRFSERTLLSSSLTSVNYYSDMNGGIDSVKFAQKDYSDYNTFTYRKVYSLRARSSLSHFWNSNSKTTVTAVFRDNSIRQNPSYFISDDYRPFNGTGNKLLAHGQENDVFFRSYALIAGHRQSFDWKRAAVTVGASTDNSPSGFVADYIRIAKSEDGHYISFQRTDSSLSDYRVNVLNNAVYSQLEISPVQRLRLVLAGRYDAFVYDYSNNLPPSASSGAPASRDAFGAFSPKAGLTFDAGAVGYYANYSQGFVPPQVTELYRAVKVPTLRPARFFNYEAGGWAKLLRSKVYADVSVYRLEGVDEIISVRGDDGTFQNRNAGRTKHEGVEYGISYRPSDPLMIRLSSSNAKHTYMEYVERGQSYSGKEMPNAPRWIANGEVIYRPRFLKGSRIGAEVQHLGQYYMDQGNTVRYPGYTLVNLRMGYEWKSLEAWVNLINAGNLHYATVAGKTRFGYSYNLGEPRNITLGLAYTLSAKK